MFRAQSKRIYLLFILLAILVLVLVWIFFTSRGDGNKRLSITECGAVANDGQDDLNAIQQCLEKAQSMHVSLFVPKGEFQISDMITLNGISMEGSGEESILVSTNPESGAINLQGEGVRLANLQHRYLTQVDRGDGANDKNSITVSNASNFIIDHVSVQKASTAGILVTGGSVEGRITNNTIEQTGADGIHITGGSSRIDVEGNEVRNTGDDTIAVVSYKEDGKAVREVTIKNNKVGFGSKARGIAVVGGEQVWIEGNTIQDTSMAGIYIATEQNWKSANTYDITVERNKVDHSGTKAGSDHPNILVYSSYGELDKVTFTENQILNAVNDGIGIWGDGNIGNIYLIKNRVENSNHSPTDFKKGTIHSTDNKGF